jgi:trimethylamine---corrinoid protein Co-methyltransferase
MFYEMKKRNRKIVRLFDSAVDAESNYKFQAAKKIYREIAQNYPKSPEGDMALDRIGDMETLSKEKLIYKKIDRKAKRILTEIGMDVGSSPQIMEILMEADAIDLESDSALFVPLKEDYVEECLEMAPTDFEEDPGENAFGTGATPPFLHYPGRETLLPANRDEFEEICKAARDFRDTVGIFSLPVATDKSISDFECAKLMAKYFPDLKMTYAKNFSNDEMLFLKNRDDWLDGTSLITSMTYMPTMVDTFIRSCKTSRNLLLLDLTIAGSTGPASPEALLTQVHAQVLFMIILAQTINPGITCIHGGIPDVLGSGGDLDYSDPGQPLINSAMARLNMWVSQLPSAQSGGSTSIINDIPAAVKESAISRNTLREYGVHILRHSLGALGSLKYFSLDKFVQDCNMERISRRIMWQTRHDFIKPLHFPEDKKVILGIREIIEKGGAKNADHTLNNIDSFNQWHSAVEKAASKTSYFPDLKDSDKALLDKNIIRVADEFHESQLGNTRERIWEVDPEYGVE